MLVDLDTLFAKALSPHVLMDRDLRMVWANDAYLAVTGRTREALIGRTMTEEFPADPDSVSDQMLRASLGRVLEHGTFDHLPLIPYPISAADGVVQERYWSATHTPLKDTAGRVEFILQTTSDVTAAYLGDSLASGSDSSQQSSVLRRAEVVSRQNLELGALAEFFKDAFAQAPGFIAVLTGPKHVFQIVNRAYTELIGRDDVVGKPVRAALPDIEGQGFFELLDQVYASGKAFTRNAARLLLHRHGSTSTEEAFVDFVFQPLRNSQGETIGIFCQGQDVTRQSAAEAELRKTQERFRMMAQKMPNHVWTALPNGDLDWLNNQVYIYSGASEGELFGSDWSKLVHPNDLPATALSWSTALAAGTDYEAEFRIRRADGAYRWHIVRAAPILAADGGVERWVGTNTDIEDRKAAEFAVAQMNTTLEERVAQRNRELEDLHSVLRQSQKMEAIGNLAGGIAHDFNNLLQAINGSLALAGRRLDTGSDARSLIAQAMKAVDRGAVLASQLLSFGRRQPLAPKVIHLGRLMREADNIIRSAIGEGIEVETIVGGGLWNTCVDPTNVESAVLNMALNARGAMEGRGKLTIEIGNAFLDDAYARAHADVTAGQYVMLAVTDTGTGMPPDIVERVFDPFFTTKPEGRGTGLGMSMVYGFVKQSGGHVKIYSEPGNGTSVKLYLPRSTAPEDRPAPGVSGEMMGGSETILVVEDDEAVRATSVSLLVDLGYTVHQACDADHAMVILESGVPVDLLFTDVVMPGKLTSREMAERAKWLFPNLAVLFTSGYTQNSIVHGGRLDAGVQLLSKPYSLEELARKLRAVLQARPGTAGYAVASTRPETDKADEGVPDPAGPPPLRVLICEDNIIIRLNLADELRDNGFAVTEAANGAKALEALRDPGIDVLVVDVGLPDMSGIDVARQAIEMMPELGIVFATGESSVDTGDALSKAQTLVKPFSSTDLLKAIKLVKPL